MGRSWGVGKISNWAHHPVSRLKPKLRSFNVKSLIPFSLVSSIVEDIQRQNQLSYYFLPQKKSAFMFKPKHLSWCDVINKQYWLNWNCFSMCVPMRPTQWGRSHSFNGFFPFFAKFWFLGSWTKYMSNNKWIQYIVINPALRAKRVWYMALQ